MNDDNKAATVFSMSKETQEDSIGLGVIPADATVGDAKNTFIDITPKDPRPAEVKRNEFHHWLLVNSRR